MMKLTILVTFALVVGAFAYEPLPDAENVCDRIEIVEEEHLVTRPKEYKIPVEYPCLLFTCKKNIIERKEDTSREVKHVKKIRRECCEGYAITPELTCAPICLKPCQFGKCIGPNRCECNPAPTGNQPGYDGPRCNRFVCSAADRWGPDCDKQCQCSDTAFCDARTGKCLCRPGWRGTNCTEECDLRSGCDDLAYLPSAYEPEVNVFKLDDNVASRALSLESQERETDSDDKRAFSKMLMAHLQINLFLVILASGLMFALFCYKKKLNELKNGLYSAGYPGSYPGGSDSSRSVYASVYGASSTIGRRPPMPLPNEPSYLSKNLSFDAATRNAISGKESRQLGAPVCIPIHSKTERHLVLSKEPSQLNIYSDIESNLDSSCAGLAASKDQLSVQTENEYQVPRSPARPMNETNSHANLYEELVPNSPAKAEDTKK